MIPCTVETLEAPGKHVKIDDKSETSAQDDEGINSCFLDLL